jgi:phospholipid-binding lipoprotein MlaA
MIKRIALALLLLLSVGCASNSALKPNEVPPMHTVSEFADQPFAYVYDPWESFNRDMYEFNFYFDKYLFLPVVRSYEFVTPVFVQHRISNIYNNLMEVISLSNSLFQLKGKEAGITLGRFLTNSTLGLGGMFDPATKWGLERRPEDFGKTLGYWGVDSGPYLVLPVFGPSSARDGVGLATDAGIRYGIYHAIKPISTSDDSFTIAFAANLMQAVDARHQQSFRYYESGYPFEYYLVRFLYHEKRELESGRPM